MNTSISFNLRLGRKAALFAVAVTVFAAMALPAQPLLITTVAGFAGKGSDNGAGAGALFNGPQAVAVDAAGNVFVADTGNNVIRVVTAAGVSSTLAGMPGVRGSADGLGTNASFNQPAGIALDGAGNVYVSDFGSSIIRKVTPAGAVTTIAGTPGVTGSANGSGSNARFFHPMGLAVDSATNVYVAEYGNHLVRKISPAYAVSTLAGVPGVYGSTDGLGGRLYQPEAVTIDQAGNVYVADAGNAAIRRISPDGTLTTLAGSPGTVGNADGSGTSALFYQPAGICADSATNLYVADYFANTIRLISRTGSVTTLAGLPGAPGSADGANSSARFWAPQGLAMGGNGTVYVADTANSTIRVMTAAGMVTTLAGSPSCGSANGAAASARFYSPRNVAVDSQNNIYVADTQNSVIRQITPLGAVTVLAGTPGLFGSADGPGATALFSGPQGIAVDADGNVYVADTGNSTIRKITPGGVTSTLAGLAGIPGNADGTGTGAHFCQPQGLAVDSGGYVYVADTGNHTIRKITPGGVSSTLAGSSGTVGSCDGAGNNARFNAPTGVAVDGSGNIYVADSNNHTIRRVTPDGVVTTLAGYAGLLGCADGAGANARFFEPAGLSVDGSGNLYAVDSGNSALRKLTLAAGAWTVSTVAGLPGAIGSFDGTGAGAEFYYPAGVTVSAAGYVFVADAGNNTIRSQGIPPSILVQPQSQTNETGSAAIFAVSVYGSLPLTYTWLYNGAEVACSGCCSLVASNAGSYQVIVTNVAGQVSSDIATLTVISTNSPPGQPGVFRSVAMLANGTMQFSLSGTPDATYTLDASTNLLDWAPLVTFSMTNGAVQFLDVTATNFPARFYRLVSP
jgi:sugar lactone lactonase YvrE